MNRQFFVRLGLYLLLIILPVFHPAVLCYADAAWLLAGFFIIPGSALIAFYADRLIGPKRFPAALLVEVVFLGFNAIIGANFTLAFGYLLAGLYAYLSTRLIFIRRWVKSYYLEPFGFFYLIYRLIGLSKASPEFSQAARPFNFVLGFIAVLGFIVYAFFIYQNEFRLDDDKTTLAEAWPLLALLPLVGLVALLVSPAAVQHLPILNRLDNILEPRPRPVAESGVNSDLNGNLLSEQARAGRNRLKTLPGSAWGSRGQTEAKERNQYLIMIVRAKASPLYLAERYLNHFDAYEGFRYDPSYQLNGLSSRHFMESWRNDWPPADKLRREVWIEVYSVLASEPSAYLPVLLEPVVKNDRYYPISYSYRAQSLVSEIGLTAIPWPLRDLISAEKVDLNDYLAVELPNELANRFTDYVRDLKLPNDYRERIEALLKSFNSFQYETGYTDDTSSQAIADFVFGHKTGDCSEFSAAAALIGRLAGIPARVVTGYLLADELRTMVHLQGLQHLQQSFQPIASITLDELYLITNAHKHAWVQFYLADYGWVDYEATQYAIPPPAGLDPNDLDLVIPTLTVREQPPTYLFPWRRLLSFMLALFGGALVYVYLQRWARLVRLNFISRQASERGAKALYRLLVIRLAARNYPLKAPSLTIREFAAHHPELSRFAALYTEYLFAPAATASNQLPVQTTATQKTKPTSLDSRYQALVAEYHQLLAAKTSPLTKLREIFSLRDLRLL